MYRFEPHFHTEYSNIRLLDAICKLEPSIQRAKDIGLKGLAITDHETLASHIKANKLNNDPDFKVVLGNEIYLCDTRDNNQKYYHFILLAKDKVGHKQLRKLSSRAWMNSYFDRGMERVVTLKSDIEEIVCGDPGHLVATSACLGGELSSATAALIEAEKYENEKGIAFYHNQIVDFVLWCKKVFGNDFLIECAPGQSKDQVVVNKRLRSIAQVFDCRMIVGSDAHYLKKEDRYVHKAFLNSKGGEREVDAFYEYTYLQTEEEIIENLKVSDFEVSFIYEMFRNSLDILDSIENYSLLHAQQIPMVEVYDYRKGNRSGDADKYPILSDMLWSDNKIERYWVNQCIGKLEQLNKLNDTYLSRLEEEADIKRVVGEKLQTNMFAYPITLQHYVNMFWECGSTVGAGRGSACSGLNHYLLGVTQLDPIKNNFPFWRYLNKERIELGDIDLDLAPSKRPMIINKIKEERGKNFNRDIDDLSRQNLGATLIATFGTESTKSAIQTACRGYRSEEYPDGIDVDTAQYLSSLVPQERGFIWPLKEMINGNPEKGRKPVFQFINTLEDYPGLLEIMQGIEGLISRRGSHASGVILFDEDPYEFGCFMKTPRGDIITQYDLHDDEAAGMTKYDFLVTDIQDKITQCIKLLQEAGQIESDLSLREIYDKYLHPEVMPLNVEDVWNNIINGKVLNCFQFDSDIGMQAAKKIKPRNIDELTDANGLMRLMTAEKGEETPMDKYIRYKNNIDLWYEEMNLAGLTQKEVAAIKPYFEVSYGVPPSQEQLMMMLMDENICHFTLAEANAARKIVGKKQMNKIPELRKKILEQAASPNLGQYIWKYGVGPQMG